jgi:hypothetical protein
LLARWETERMISDPAEHETAIKVRSRARAMITGVCAQSSFGLLCPEANASNLEIAIREARRLTDEFNDSARLTRVTVYVIAGRVAADDVEATRAINSEVAGLLEIMQNGIKNLDVTAVREAANKARAIGSMLTPAASERVKGAIDAARAAARKIAKAGETAGVEVDLQAMNVVATARTAFLDLDEQAEIGQVEEDGRAVDLAPTDAQIWEDSNADLRESERECSLSIDEIGSDIRDAMIEQQVAGLRVMPQFLPKLEEMAGRGDETAQEVVRRFKEESPQAAPVPQFEIE